jgi:hypothetical protein
LKACLCLLLLLLLLLLLCCPLRGYLCLLLLCCPLKACPCLLLLLLLLLCCPLRGCQGQTASVCQLLQVLLACRHHLPELLACQLLRWLWVQQVLALQLAALQAAAHFQQHEPPASTAAAAAATVHLLALQLLWGPTTALLTLSVQLQPLLEHLIASLALLLLLQVLRILQTPLLVQLLRRHQQLLPQHWHCLLLLQLSLQCCLLHCALPLLR